MSGTEVKEVLKREHLTIYDLVTMLEANGTLPKQGGNSNYVTVSYALSGKRSGKRYIEILNECSKLLRGKEIENDV